MLMLLGEVCGGIGIMRMMSRRLCEDLKEVLVGVLCRQWERERAAMGWGGGRWCGKYKRDNVKFSSGEGIAIGDRPCEFQYGCMCMSP